jgi:bifunctional non-homologous end joining protein LigD
MLATSTDVLPSGAGWAFEPKWDGYRALVRVRDGQATLQSRHGNDLTTRFPGVARAIALAVRERSAVLDGEVCAVDDTGRSDFGRLQRGEGVLVFVAFDLIELQGEPLLRRTYLERRDELARLLDTSYPGW